MNRSHQQHYSFAAIVTSDFLPEFRLLKYSLELFEGSGFTWHLRCDRPTAEALADDPNIKCSVFVDSLPCVIPPSIAEYRLIAYQKLQAIRDAYSHGASAVISVDADLVFTAPILSALDKHQKPVLLSPHYCPAERIEEEQALGAFNAGFVLSRTPKFAEWWLETYLAQTSLSEQKSLEHAESIFKAGMLGREANIGIWRAGKSLDFPPIPSDCSFVHVQLLQPALSPSAMVGKIFANSVGFGVGRQPYRPAFSPVQLAQRSFGLHCLRFLQNDPDSRRQALCAEILKRDSLGLYSAALAA